jgi:NADPH-dependent glutamate synthase beta subunit-like oxidoreductase
MINQYGQRINDLNQQPANQYNNNGDGIHSNHIMNREKQGKIRRAQTVINTNHCRSELDTIQYVIGKNGYRETN